MWVLLLSWCSRWLEVECGLSWCCCVSSILCSFICLVLNSLLCSVGLLFLVLVGVLFVVECIGGWKVDLCLIFKVFDFCGRSCCVFVWWVWVLVVKVWRGDWFDLLFVLCGMDMFVYVKFWFGWVWVWMGDVIVVDFVVNGWYECS